MWIWKCCRGSRQSILFLPSTISLLFQIQRLRLHTPDPLSPQSKPSLQASTSVMDTLYKLTFITFTPLFQKKSILLMWGLEGWKINAWGLKEHEVVKFFQKFLNVFMLLLNFILGLNFINFLQISLFLDMVMIIVLKQRKQFKPGRKFNHNMCKG